MALYRQNDELTTVYEALVEKNEFVGATGGFDRLVSYGEAKKRLPKPIWDGHRSHLACYDKAWELAFSNLCVPTENSGFVSSFIDTAFNGCLFMWDSAFILMFAKYADRIFNFQKTLDNLYSHQHSDGFICREIEEKSGCDRFTKHDPSSTGPNVLAWCEWEYYLNFSDKQRLLKVFYPLLCYHRWLKKNRTWRDGTYFSSGWGCGMDNLPRLQPQYDRCFDHGHMVWVDACMQMLLSCKLLINMARELSLEEFIPELEAEKTQLEAVINGSLWDEKDGFYYDRYSDGSLNSVRHVGAFWALIAECASPERAERMIERLIDEKEFDTPFPVPALTKSHPDFSADGGYWRGGVWAPVTYMVLKGLDNYKKPSLAHRIAKKHLDAVVEVFERENTLFENYAPEKLGGSFSRGGQSKADFVGWTGLSPIAVLFEFVFGIKPLASENKIVWNVELLERHGVERYPFGKDGELTLICEARSDRSEEPKITVKSNRPVEIEVLWDGKSKLVRT